GHGRLRPGPGHRPLRRAQVPRPVVENDDVGLAHKTPFVDGTAPPARGSNAAADRSARATALNCASTIWCGLRPYSTCTCRQIPAENARDSQMCRVSVVS